MVPRSQGLQVPTSTASNTHAYLFVLIYTFWPQISSETRESPLKKSPSAPGGQECLRQPFLEKPGAWSSGSGPGATATLKDTVLTLEAEDLGQEAELRHTNKPGEHLPRYTAAAIGKHQIREEGKRS